MEAVRGMKILKWLCGRKKDEKEPERDVNNGDEDRYVSEHNGL